MDKVEKNSEKTANFKITLNVAGQEFSLTIKRENEEVYRRAEKEIGSWINYFESEYKAKDDGIFLAMAALQIAVGKVQLELSRSLGDDVDQMVEMEEIIDNYLLER